MPQRREEAILAKKVYYPKCAKLTQTALGRLSFYFLSTYSPTHSRMRDHLVFILFRVYSEMTSEETNVYD